MTRAEMNRRLATMTEEQIYDVLAMIRHGYGAHGISNNYPVTVAQANACFELASILAKDSPRADHRAEANFGC